MQETLRCWWCNASVNCQLGQFVKTITITSMSPYTLLSQWHVFWHHRDVGNKGTNILGVHRFVPLMVYVDITMVNSLRPRQNGRSFGNDTFKRIFLNEKVRISIKISLKFVPKGPINNNPALVQIMAWRRPGDKPLSELMMVSLLTHICVTRSQWVNRRRFHTLYMIDHTKYHSVSFVSFYLIFANYAFPIFHLRKLFYDLVKYVVPNMNLAVWFEIHTHVMYIYIYHQSKKMFIQMCLNKRLNVTCISVVI